MENLCLYGVVLIFHAFIPVASQSEFKFTSKKWIVPNIPASFNVPPRKYVPKDNSLIFSCQTNDNDASITLLYTRNPTGPYQDAAIHFQSRIVTQGQNFSVNQIALTDSGHYKCKAKNKNNIEIELKLGQLFVDKTPKVYKPNIYPSQSILSIEVGANVNVSCKAHGAVGEKNSYLKWYKEVDGNKVSVDSSMVIRTELIHDAEHIDEEILAFKSFSKAYTGNYTCVRQVATNPATETKIEIKLEPNASPKLKFADNAGDFISKKEGDKVTVTCVVEGSPTPKRYWERNGVVVQDCPDYSNPRCTLALPRVTFPDNNGKYVCVGENIVKTTKKELFVEVQVPPVLKKQPTLIQAIPGEDREVLCTLHEGNPHPTFVWQAQPNTCDPETKTDCTPIEEDWVTVEKQYPSSSIGTNTSYIISTRSVDYFYRCSAKSKAGNDTHTIQLVRTEKAPPHFLFTSSGTYLNEKDQVAFQCVADKYVYKDVEIVGKNGQKLPATSQDVNGTKTLSYTISSLEVSDSGEFKCKVKLTRGGEKEKSLTITVKALQAPSISNFNDITISQDEITNFNITCTASGNPEPNVTWKHNGEPIKRVEVDSMESCLNMNPGIYYARGVENVLVFCKLNYSMHGGDYECNANNKVDIDTKTLTLTVNAMPKILRWRNITTFSVGLSKELECATTANPPANVTWIHVSSNTTMMSSHLRKNVLKFESMDSTKEGEYKCIASNEFGEVTLVTYVQIAGVVTVPVTMLERKQSTVYGVAIGCGVILAVVAILVFLYRRHLKKKYALYLEPNDSFVLDRNRSLFEQSSELPYDLAWEFPRERVKLLKTLGAGAFGQVWLAEANEINDFKPRDHSSDARKRRKAIQKSKRYQLLKNKPTELPNSSKHMVAIKTLKDDASEGEYKDLASELKILIHLGEHKNIVNLLGACTTGGKLLVILECCPYGNLLNFLREKREVFRPYWLKIDNDVEKEFTYVDLISIGYQISQGMDFLQSKKCVHRDLAARNILVGENYVMKIADFGLARDIYKDEIYLKQTTSLLPVKWMAPESLFDKVYTPSSDVWSFGILLWEVFTLGGSPYPGLPTEDLFSYLQDGRRMERPDLCPVDVYEIMLNCWEKSPFKRPLFAQIGEKFGHVMLKNSPEDSQYLSLVPSNGHYLNPGNRAASKPSLDSAEYIESVGNGRVFSSPKGETYVPSPDLTLHNDLNEDEGYPTTPKTPLMASTDIDYVPMTPADHYQTPNTFSYGQEAMV